MEDLQHFKKTDQFFAGTDEVGRGPLAGPVVGCCFILGKPTSKKLKELILFSTENGVTDSKKLSQIRRKEIIKSLGLNLDELKAGCKYDVSCSNFEDLSFAIVEISNVEIDNINILQASLKAMRTALTICLEDKKSLPGGILIDGNKILRTNNKLIRETPLVKGDSRSAMIGLSSIVAKEYRDLLMAKFARKFPGYGFEKHAGYPTKFHKEAVQKLGPTKIHRKNFKGVKEYLQRRGP